MQSTLGIVTVVKDDLSGLQRTQDSLAATPSIADLPIEWIVVDSSADRQEIPNYLAAAEVPSHYLWVPPEGVFAAMNVGWQATGANYVYFLNSGDRLFDETSLASMVRGIQTSNPTWLFGQVAFADAKGHRVVPPAFDYGEARKSLFAGGRFPPHQGTIVQRNTLKELGGFDESYKITADYTLMLRLSQVDDPVEIPEVLAEFAPGGVSQQRWLLAANEFHRARLEVFRPRGLQLAKEFAATGHRMLETAVARAIKR